MKMFSRTIGLVVQDRSCEEYKKVLSMLNSIKFITVLSEKLFVDTLGLGALVASDDIKKYVIIRGLNDTRGHVLIDSNTFFSNVVSCFIMFFGGTLILCGDTNFITNKINDLRCKNDGDNPDNLFSSKTDFHDMEKRSQTIIMIDTSVGNWEQSEDNINKLISKLELYPAIDY